MPEGDHKKRSARKCPICGKKTAADWRPFCSNHCADIDLDRWLGGRYAIPGEPAELSVDRDYEESG